MHSRGSIRAIPGMTAMAAVVAVASAGCAEMRWSEPYPTVEPTARILYSLTHEERHTTVHTWKRGATAGVDITATRVRALDAATCELQRTIMIPGVMTVLAWDGDDVWYRSSPDDEKS